MVFTLALFIYICINKDKRTFWSFFALFIIFFYFMFSGTRSSMLVPFFLVGFSFYVIYKDHPKTKLFIYPILFLGSILFISLIISLATDTNEASNTVKYGHLASYITLFENNPSYLITGQGPGALFYTEGFSSIVSKTEWTYLDLIRQFGVFSLLIVGVFAWPLITFWKQRQEPFTFIMAGTYFAYLLIAGTNPLMLSSTGILILLLAYSYRETITNNNLQKCI